MHDSVMQWAERQLRALPSVNWVLECGSMNVNGTLRDMIVELFGPSIYIGTDMQPGPGVDLTIPAEHCDLLFQPRAFDMVVSTEMLEHTYNWRLALVAMANLVRHGGYLLLTTRSPGFPRHGYPDDHWRFTNELIQRVMDQLHFVGEVVNDDPTSPGVLYLGRKADTAEFPLSYLIQYDAEPVP